MIFNYLFIFASILLILNLSNLTISNFEHYIYICHIRVSLFFEVAVSPYRRIGIPYQCNLVGDVYALMKSCLSYQGHRVVTAQLKILSSVLPDQFSRTRHTKYLTIFSKCCKRKFILSEFSILG
jgi:hypothetical protein